MEKELLSIREVSEQLSLSRPTVYELLRREKHPLPTVSIGKRRLIPRRALQDWVDREMKMG